MKANKKNFIQTPRAFKTSALVPCCFALSLLTFASAQAQVEPLQQNEAAEQGLTIERIEVTARRTTESLQSTPVAISAFTATAMENKGLVNSSDIGNFTPNVQFDTSSSFAGASTFQGYIRGIGQSDFAINTDPGVGVYVDGVYYARTVGSVIDLMDVERIEVLKGPQGTLFGRNTIGGALNIITATPKEEFDFKGDMTIGDFNRADLSAFVNIPVNDELFTSFAMSTRNRDGFQQRIALPDTDNVNLGLSLDQVLTADINNGAAQGAIDSQTARAKAFWYATDDIEVTLTADYASIRDSATATTLLDAEADTEGGLRSLFNGCVLGLAPASICDTSAFIANETMIYDNQFLTGDIDTTFASGANFSNIDSWGLSAIVAWDLSEALQFKSITAIRKLDGAFGVDIDS